MSLLFLSTLTLKGVILKVNNIYMIPVLWLQVLLDNLKYFNILLVHGHSSAHSSGFLRESLCALTFCLPHIFPNLPFTLFMLWWLNGKPMAATAGAQQAAAELSPMLAHTTHLSLSPPTLSDSRWCRWWTLRLAGGDHADNFLAGRCHPPHFWAFVTSSTGLERHSLGSFSRQ